MRFELKINLNNLKLKQARSRSKDRSQMSLQESPESSVFGSDPYGDSDKSEFKMNKSATRPIISVPCFVN